MRVDPVSRDDRFIAMVCRHGQHRTADLTVAPPDLASSSLGAPETLVSGRLVASPSFSGDGAAIAYLSPSSAGGQFQLWTIPSPASLRPGPAVQVTQNLGFDSTSGPVWVG